MQSKTEDSRHVRDQTKMMLIKRDDINQKMNQGLLWYYEFLRDINATDYSIW